MTCNVNHKYVEDTWWPFPPSTKNNLVICDGVDTIISNDAKIDDFDESSLVDPIVNYRQTDEGEARW